MSGLINHPVTAPRCAVRPLLRQNNVFQNKRGKQRENKNPPTPEDVISILTWF